MSEFRQRLEIPPQCCFELLAGCPCLERQRISRIGSTCTGTTANIAGEAERTNSAAMTLAVMAFVDATMALIVVFSSIVLPPVNCPAPFADHCHFIKSSKLSE